MANSLKLLNAFDCDPDFRRNPKTQVFFWRCQKDLKPDQPKRWIHLVGGGNQILHPDSEADYQSNSGDCGCFPVGMDCARRIGIEWTFEGPKQ